MDVRETLVADFDNEMAVTRRLLARVPDNALAWKPHEKSFSLGGLSAHLARLPHWGAQILEGDAYDLASAAPDRRQPEPESIAAVLAAFDRHVAEVRRSLTDRPAAALDAPWSLTRDGRTLLTLPKAAAIRRFLLHHLVHHRGQLTVYLRLLDVPLPPIYGPSADEGR